MTLSEYVKAMGSVKLAELLGVTRSTTHNWQTNKSPPSVELAFRLIQSSNGLLTWEGIYDEYATIHFK